MTLLALATPAFPAVVWHKDVASAQKAAKANKQLILVDMVASWCGWCRRFEQEVYPSPVFENATKDVVLLRLDTEDGKEGSEFSTRYGVSQLPTFLLLTSDLTVAGYLSGYAPAVEFAQRLDNTRKQYAAFIKLAGDDSSIANNPVQRLSLAKELTQRRMFDKAEPRLKKLIADTSIPLALRDDASFTLAVAYAMQTKYNESLAVIHELTARSKLGEAVENARALEDQIEQALAAQRR